MAERELPLFPLPLVLFPGMSLPLDVFEPRYQQLLADIQAADGCFGLVLLDADADEPQQTLVHTTGTIAHLEEVEMLPEGRANILVRGGSRFQVLDWLEGAPYARARIAVLDGPEDEG